MYCPRCGGNEFSLILSDSISEYCVYCEKTIYNSNDVLKDLPIMDEKKAQEIRNEYNKIPGNKEKGEKNTIEHTKIVNNYECLMRQMEKFHEICKDVKDSPTHINVKKYYVSWDKLLRGMLKENNQEDSI